MDEKRNEIPVERCDAPLQTSFITKAIKSCIGNSNKLARTCEAINKINIFGMFIRKHSVLLQMKSSAPFIRLLSCFSEHFINKKRISFENEVEPFQSRNPFEGSNHKSLMIRILTRSTSFFMLKVDRKHQMKVNSKKRFLRSEDD